MNTKYLLTFILLCLPHICFSQDPTANGGCLLPANLGSKFSVADSNYLSSGRCAFLASNFADDTTTGEISLTVSAASCQGVGANCGDLDVGCAEAVATQKTYYGFYECDVAASGVNGTVVSCMVESTTRAPYESIYIKLLGNETGRVFTGYFYGGVNYQTGPITLSALTTTLIPHKYSFEWTSGHIIWYIDGAVVTSEYGNRPIPTQPNTFLINYVIEETGFVTDDSSLSTQYVERNYVPDNATSTTVTFTNFSYTPVAYKACTAADGYNPGGQPYAAYDPNGCSPLPENYIYNESFINGWSLNSPSLTSGGYSLVQRSGYDCYVTTPQIRSGNNAIQYTPLPGASLYFIPTTPFSTSDYYSFEFWINGGSRSGQQIVVSLVFSDQTTSQTVNIAQIVSAGVQSCIWSRVVIPFTSMGVSSNGDVVITAIQLSSATASTASPTVYIDDVRLGQQYPICPNETELVFGDSLSSEWSDKSYPVGGSSAPQLGATDITFNASQASIKWNLYDQSSGLFLQRNDPWNTNDYQAVSFWMYTAKLQGYNWNIGFGSPDSQATDSLAGIGQQNILIYYGGNLPQGDNNQWTHIVIPFNELGIYPNSRLNSVRIYLTTSDYQGIMWIDDMQLISNNPPKTSTQDSASSTIKASMLGLALMVVAFVL